MFGGVITRIRSIWQGIRRRPDVEADMSEEFRLHLELRAQDLLRRGLTPTEAVRRARIEFGSTEEYKDQGRASRGLRRVDQIRFSWLDFKLGFRMLVRYPWLTLVGGFAMAFATWAGAGAFEFVRQVVNPTLPLPEGDRVVALRNWNAASSTVDPRVLHDFVSWRDELRSIVDLGAARTVELNLITREGLGEPVQVAEMTASGFRLTRVPPLLGRTLINSDEAPGAPNVLVIGYGVWQRRFAGDSNVVGRSVQLNGVASTVVGVMPQGFEFPVAHQLWVPLRLNAMDHERGAGSYPTDLDVGVRPAFQVFGRLAPDATMDAANAELTTIGQRAARQYPKTHEHLRPQVMRYARSVVDISLLESAAFGLVDVFLALLLMLICGNVALLLFARAATRENEIIVRTALGASRARIITQLFAEALVLGGIAAIIGLAAASFGLEGWLGAIEGITERQLPFWFDPTLAPSTLLYSSVLALLGAVIAGVIPALKITRGVGAQLRQATAGGGGGIRFGGIWTAIIVMQVAVTVTFPAVAFYVRRDAVQVRSIEAGIPAHEYLAARLVVAQGRSPAPNDSSAAVGGRFAATITEVERRLRSDPNVVAVTFADRLPLMSHEWQQIEVDGGAIAPRDSALGHRVAVASLDVGYFDELGTPLIAGRRFSTSDLGTPVAIVNATFVDSLLQGRNAIGRRVRRVTSHNSANPNAEPEPWFEIIGVAKNLGMKSGYGRAGIYYPVARSAVSYTHIAVHVRGDPRSFIPRLRQTALETDPALRVYNAMPLNEVTNADLQFLAFWFRLTMLVSAVALLLSLTGIYAVMSFTVSRRTREIGIRVALGADPRRIVSAIFRRPLAQVGLGITVGGVLVTAFSFGVMRGALWPTGAAFIIAYAVLMMGVCALACIVPTRRALGIEPTEALRIG
jgi:predicted permease